MVTMIALVGEQPLPNLFPVYHYRPEEILFVYTTKTLPYCQHLQSALQKQAKIHELSVDPYSVPDITVALQAKLEALGLAPSSSLIFNVTGGTKPMMKVDIILVIIFQRFFVAEEAICWRILKALWR
ncbi:MAG TPA: DUF1887 family CARF protein [Ktedonobacteraceae bacterium]|nr:DUF1887 family CARF protein [Ktedonobacteraceae bacterium]